MNIRACDLMKDRIFFFLHMEEVFNRVLRKKKLEAHICCLYIMEVSHGIEQCIGET